LALLSYNHAATRSRRWNTLLGASAAIASAVVGTGVIAYISDDSKEPQFSLGLALLSTLAAALTAAHTFAGFGSRISEYERAARQYGVVRRDLEVALAEWHLCAVACKKEDIAKIARALDEAADNTPNAPGSIWARNRRHMKGQFTRRERLWGWVRGVTPKPIGDDHSDLSSDEVGQGAEAR